VLVAVIFEKSKDEKLMLGENPLWKFSGIWPEICRIYSLRWAMMSRNE
jgi:hypothetical protein